MATFRLEIVTAERELYAGDVELLVAPGREGQLGILAHHAPLLTQLDPGEIAIRNADGEELSVAVTGGFLEVLGNKAVILADAAEYAHEIDIERAETALRRAEERVASRAADIDLERALAAIRRSRVRINVARRRRRAPARPGAREE